VKSRCYALRGSCVELAADWDAAFEWADLCLVPYITIGTAPMRAASVRCHYNVTRELPHGVDPELRRIHMGQMAEAVDLGDGECWLRSGTGAVYHRSAGVIEAYYPDRCEDSLRDPTRLCREILYNSLPAECWVELHASAVASNGKALVFTGGKGAGKTTIISHMLSRKNHANEFDFISNDRVWVHLGEDTPHILGSPMPIRVGYGTMAFIPELTANLHLYRDQFHIVTRNWEEKTHEYSTVEFANMFQSRICCEAEVVAIIRLRAGASNLLRPVVSQESRAELLIESIKDKVDTYPNWMEFGTCSNERGTFADYWERLTCPVFEMEFNPRQTAVMKCDDAVISCLGDLLH